MAPKHSLCLAAQEIARNHVFLCCFLHGWWNVVVTLRLVKISRWKAVKSSNLTWLDPRPSDGVLSSRPDDRTQFLETKLHCWKNTDRLHTLGLDRFWSREAGLCYPKVAEAKGMHDFTRRAAEECFQHIGFPSDLCYAVPGAGLTVFDPSLCKLWSQIT